MCVCECVCVCLCVLITISIYRERERERERERKRERESCFGVCFLLHQQAYLMFPKGNEALSRNLFYSTGSRDQVNFKLMNII